MKLRIEAACGQLGLFSYIENRLQMMTVSDVGLLINLKKTDLYQKVQAGRIPYMLIDGTIRFEPMAIASWLKSQVVVSGTCYMQEERRAA